MYVHYTPNRPYHILGLHQFGSLMLVGPSPALASAILTRGAAKGSIGLGLLAFQVGSALAAVPAFTVMQAGVASMGKGGNNAVASVHSLSIGLGEVIGPVLGGIMLELLPRSPVRMVSQGGADTAHNPMRVK